MKTLETAETLTGKETNDMADTCQDRRIKIQPISLANAPVLISPIFTTIRTI